MIRVSTCAALSLVLAIAAACDDAAVAVDAEVVALDAEGVATTDGNPTLDVICEGCNPLAQTGCAPGESCGVRWSGPCRGSSGCLRGATRGLNDACTIDEHGFDDCAAGLICTDGFTVGSPCHPICAVGFDLCAVGECIPVPGYGDLAVCVDALVP